MAEVHHLVAECIKSQTQVFEPTLTVISRIVEKVELTDKVAVSEKAQIVKWFEDRFEDVSTTANDPSDFIQVMTHELSKLVSDDSLQWLVDLVKSFIM